MSIAVWRAAAVVVDDDVVVDLQRIRMDPSLLLRLLKTLTTMMYLDVAF